MMKCRTSRRRKRWAFLSLLMLIPLLILGLRGKDFHFLNDVDWLKDEPGVRFGNFGLAYAGIDEASINCKLSDLKAFSIEMVIYPKERIQSDGFKMILTFHDGDDRRQLFLGQYRSFLVVMNGDDYENKKKVNRIAAQIFAKRSEKMYLTLTSGMDGTKLYVNGECIQSKPDLILKVSHGNKTRMTLGNSVYGKNPWAGFVYGLAFYSDSLDPKTVAQRYGIWSRTHEFPFPKEGHPLLFYPLDEKTGREAVDRLSGRQKLLMPSCFPILEKRFLTLPGREVKADFNLFWDVVLNLLGFVPLSAVLYMLFYESGGFFRQRAVILSVGLCFLISLGIETAQVWIPSRTSQMTDLLFNTLGGVFGASTCKFLMVRRVAQKISRA